MMNRKPAQVFDKLKDGGCIRRSMEYGRWTIPTITANLDGSNYSGAQQVVRRDYQEIGALLVNSLASNLVDILFPVQVPFFRASMSSAMKDELEQRGEDTAAVEKSLALAGKLCSERLHGQRGRASLILALKHLIVTGNAALHRDTTDGHTRVYGLGDYVVERDYNGKVMQAVVRETTTWRAVPPDVRKSVQSSDPDRVFNDDTKVVRYWWLQITYRGKRVGYTVSEWLDGAYLTESWYPAAVCPWVFPTWNLIPGEHYGHGHVEDYSTGFRTLSELSAGSLEYAVEMMRVLYAVGPGAGTQVRDLQNAPTGRYVFVDPSQVSPFETNGGQKLAQVDAKIDSVIQRLTKAFMYSGPTRDAERVTAYELQRTAAEAQKLLGSVYNTLADDLQVPLASFLLVELDKDFEVALAGRQMKIQVLSGTVALGQVTDIENLLSAAQQIAAIIPVAQLDKRIDPARVVDVVLLANSIDSEKIMFTPEQQRANEEAAQASQNAQQSLLEAGNAAQQSETIQQALGG